MNKKKCGPLSIINQWQSKQGDDEEMSLWRAIIKTTGYAVYMKILYYLVGRGMSVDIFDCMNFNEPLYL